MCVCVFFCKAGRQRERERDKREKIVTNIRLPLPIGISLQASLPAGTTPAIFASQTKKPSLKSSHLFCGPVPFPVISSSTLAETDTRVLDIPGTNGVMSTVRLWDDDQVPQIREKKGMISWMRLFGLNAQGNLMELVVLMGKMGRPTRIKMGMGRGVRRRVR